MNVECVELCLTHGKHILVLAVITIIVASYSKLVGSSNINLKVLKRGISYSLKLFWPHMKEVLLSS